MKAVRLARSGCWVFFKAKKQSCIRPEGGAATARFLVLQHERGRCAALGPSAYAANSGEPLT
jgi:hypothetical protein